MICQKCGREAVVLLGGLCGPCSRGERYQRIGASAAAVLTTTDRCEDAKRIAALVALNEQKDAEIARLRAVGIDPDEWHRRLAAAYERGAREFAEDVKTNDPELRNYVDIDEHLARFLASRGTGIAESKAEEG